MSAEVKTVDLVEIKGVGVVDSCQGILGPFIDPCDELNFSFCGETCALGDACKIVPLLLCLPLTIFCVICAILEQVCAPFGVNCCNPTKEVPEGSNLVKAGKSNVVVVPVAGAPSDLEMGR